MSKKKSEAIGGDRTHVLENQRPSSNRGFADRFKYRKGERGTDHDQITELYLCAQTAEGLALPLDGVPYFPTHDIAFDTAHYPSNAVLPQLPPPPYYPRFVVGLEPQFDDQPISPLKLKLLN